MRSAAQVDALLGSACEGGTIPGAVAAVADRDGVIYQGAFGWADAERTVRLDDRSVFRLASMTKLITAVAVLRLVDAGQLALDDAVSQHLPEFASIDVLEGFDGERPRLRRPSRSPTVRELLSHCSGLSYEVWNADVLRYQALTGTPAISSGKRAVLDTPLVGDPGTVVEYGTGFDWAGQLVERLTGVSLDAYCREEIFVPLGMAHTSLWPLTEPGLQYPPVLSRRADKFVSTEIDYPCAPEFVTGGGCFYSTAADYLALERALLAGGGLDGVRLLSAACTDQLISAQSFATVPALRTALPWLSADMDPGADWHWGLGLMVNGRGVPGGRSAGSGGWWGIFNTTFWIDRRAGIAANLMMQFVPFHCEAAAAVARQFERAVYAELA